MKSFYRLALVVVVALALGLGATALALRGDPAFGGVRIGAWSSWPHLGAPDIDPYARAVIAVEGVLPLGANEGLAFVATEDDDGAPLDTHCAYEISGPALPARLWTLASYRPSGQPASTEPGRFALSSAGLLRGAEGEFAIAAARGARPGNWLPLGESGAFILVLRLYQASSGALSDAYDGLVLPKIKRGGCS